MRRRIVLSIDSSSRGRKAVHWAVRAASTLQLDLTGLFLEDERILRMASLPLTKELGLLAGDVRAFETADVERHLRREARELELLLKRLTHQYRLSFSFETVRGDPFQAMHSRRQADDIMLLGFSDTRVHSIDWARQKSSGPIAVFLDNDTHSKQTLAVAERLARQESRPLLVLHPTALSADALTKLVDTLQVPVRTQSVSGIEQLVQRARLFHADLLVLPDGGRLGDPTYLQLLAGEIPVLLV